MEEDFDLAKYVQEQAKQSGVPEFVEDAAVLAQAAQLTASIVEDD